MSILAAGSATPRSDLYALGAVGYFLLTGTPLFQCDSIDEVLARHVREEPEFPSERLGHALPQDLEYVIMGCLAKDPSERPPSARVVAEMLEACDCGVWSTEAAELWWDEYGEVARRASAPEEARASTVQTELEVAVEDTRA